MANVGTLIDTLRENLTKKNLKRETNREKYIDVINYMIYKKKEMERNNGRKLDVYMVGVFKNIVLYRNEKKIKLSLSI